MNEQHPHDADTSPSVPDGIGLDLESVRTLLAQKHAAVVDPDDPVLMSCGLTLLLVLATVSLGNTLVVYCTNCSEMFTQALERVTNLSQLETLVSQYQEAVTQTIEQIEMVANQVKQYQNMDGLFDRVLLIVGVGGDQEKIEITREKS